MEEAKPAHIQDIARVVLEAAREPISTMKLQKLCYLAQGWTLAWTDGLPLFDEDFEAWRSGPVCPPLWELHKNLYVVATDSIPAVAQTIDQWRAEATQAAIKPYLHLTSTHLKEISQKGPWVDARNMTPVTSPSHEIIAKDAIRAFFAQLDLVT